MEKIMATNNADSLIPFDEPNRQPARPDKAGSQPVILKAIYYAEPGSSDDAIFARIVAHGGEITFSSRCRCCDRREIAALFGDRARALGTSEVLKANWDAEVEILPFVITGGDHASHENPIRNEHSNVVGAHTVKRPCHWHVVSE
ncbi:MAG: hypothetical protein ABFC88_02425 [Thermoguttaceae bacterium]